MEEFDERKDPSGRPYFWLTGTFLNYERGKTDTDVWAVENNYVSVVPTQFDLTAYPAILHAEKLFGNEMQKKKNGRSPAKKKA